MIKKILLITFTVIIVATGIIFLSSQLNQNKSVQPIKSSEFEKQLFKPQGYQSKLKFGESLKKLIQSGALDQQKINSLYSKQPKLRQEFGDLVNDKNKQIHLTDKNANLYLNLLWPIGLANRMEINKKSPLTKEANINSFASTGGWSLGQAKEGGKYFNKYQIIQLTSAQENLIYQISSNIYRPCCNNNTFFQDCNHGSALLGLLELGAAQGLSEDELFYEALAFNSYWFPNEYLTLAIYFQRFYQKSWSEVEPKVILSKQFSSLNGWQNVDRTLKKLGIRQFQSPNSSGC